MSITPDQVASYRKNGYVRLCGVFDQPTIASLQGTTESFVERSKLATESDNVFDLSPTHSLQIPHLRRIKDPEKQHPIYAETHTSSLLLDILAYLIGPDIRAHSSKLNLKEPDTLTAVEWHQDWAYGAQTNDDILTVGIALSDISISNGCLLVMPGSHTGKIWNHHQGEEFVGAVTDQDFDPSMAVPIELKAGNISIHHIRLLHSSAPNTSNVSRRLLLFSYQAADSWPLARTPDRDKYNSMMLRGSPPDRPRLEKLPLGRTRWDNPETKTLFELQDRFEGARYKES